MSDESSEHGKRRNSGLPNYNNALAFASRKRVRLDGENTDDAPNASGLQEVDSTRPKRKLSHADYTIAWICALSLELTAARCMLDEEHETLEVAPSDDNVYILGSITGRNVVMTSLRAGVYGLVSAAVAGKDILATFPNVKSTPLLVGVGGGCPSPSHDIRLGDVVVSKPTSESPAIRQYDSGKTVHNGKLEIKGSNNKPAPVLLNAVANLEARHDSLGTQIQRHIIKACQTHRIIHEHPGIDLDVLFETGCGHIKDDTVCGICGPLKPISRRPRSSLCPEVHFGPIASGNQVIKDAITRSRLASEHGFLCFEMEAAGLMDFLPCLVIRGICDYCDSSKHKRFQEYAAFNAAAFAKELISVLPRKTTTVEQTENPTADRLEHRKLIIEKLDFVEADSRRATIGKAHHQTCRWLFKQEEYINWHEHWRADSNNALLWLKGNPGTGKSTIMKFILEEVEKHKSKNDIIVSFFFNARGEPLERTTEGLYRSLVVQLLTQLSDLQWLLEKITITDSRGNLVLDRVIELFRSIFQAIHGKEVICLVDALDECSEQEIRRMLNDFVAILEHAGTQPNFRVLFSSRHYPHISIEAGQSFILEKQDGHANDLAKYIQTELKIGKTKQADKLKQEVLEKANGIFLWVVLVVNILKREYDRGRIHDMARRLKEIPVELNQLFKEILLRGNNDVNELVLCIQWCLYSQRPLNREEFYFAMLAGNDGVPIEPWDQEEATTEIMDKFILDCSKGLAEMTRGKKPVVQFIHESVREFFLAPDTLSSLSNDFHDITQAGAHEKLRNCCRRLLLSEVLDFLDSPDEPIGRRDRHSWERVRLRSTSFPFFEYAASFVLHHVDKAGQAGQDQAQFLRDFCAPRWARFHNIVQKSGTRRISQDQLGVLLYLMCEPLPQLVVVWLDTYHPDYRDIRSLLETCARERGDDTTKRFLYECGQRILSQKGDIDSMRFEVFIDLLLDGLFLNTAIVIHLSRWIWISAVEEGKDEDTKEIIRFAARMKRSRALEFLLDATYPLRQELEPDFAKTVLKAILDHTGGRRLPPILSELDEPTTSKSSRGLAKANESALLDIDTKACVEILISRGVQIETVSQPGDIIGWAGLNTIHFLLHQDSLWVRKSFLASNLVCGASILHKAIRCGRPPAYIQLLVHHGADINAKNENGDTPLEYCARFSVLRAMENAQTLINHGAQLDRVEEAAREYLYDSRKIEEIKAMVPQTPCCTLGIQADTAPQSSDGDISVGNCTGRPEQSSHDESTGNGILETADTSIPELDDSTSSEILSDTSD